MEAESKEFYKMLTDMTFYLIQRQNGVGGNELKNKLDFIENSIKVLPEEDNKLINAFVYEKQPIKNIMAQNNISRNIVYYRLKRIAKIMAKAYSEGKT